MMWQKCKSDCFGAVPLRIFRLHFMPGTDQSYNPGIKIADCSRIHYDCLPEESGKSMNKKKMPFVFLLCLRLSGCSLLDRMPQFTQISETQKARQAEELRIQPSDPAREEAYRWFYYYQLPREEQDLYNRLRNGIETGATEVDARGLSDDQVNRVWMALCFDNPAYFWLQRLSTGRLNDEIQVVVLPEKTEEIAAQQEQVNEAVEAVVEKAGDQDPWQMLKSFVEQIDLNTEYVEDASYLSDVRSVFLNGQAVCGGYSRAFQLLCQKAGIPCIYVTGYDSQGENHAWNQVILNEQPYWIDATWIDTTMSSSDDADPLAWQYFCSSDDRFLKDHTVHPALFYEDVDYGEDFQIPSCPVDDLNYFVIAQDNIPAGDEAQVLAQADEILRRQLQEPERTRFDFQFEDPDNLELFCSTYLDGQEFFRTAQQVRPQNIPQSIRFARDDNNLVVTVFIKTGEDQSA